MTIDTKVFDENFANLEKVFSAKQINGEKERLKEVFINTEKAWHAKTKQIGLTRLKYILICEAPPCNPAKYFYNLAYSSFFTRIWKGVKPHINKPINSDDSYKKLTNIGFMLIDSLPFSMKYETRHRKSDPYLSLIGCTLEWWRSKINDHFDVDDNIKIALGFKCNAEQIIKATEGKIAIGSKERPISDRNIVADGSGHPNSQKISDIFGIEN